jgi:hypothetical protein
VIAPMVERHVRPGAQPVQDVPFMNRELARRL